MPPEGPSACLGRVFKAYKLYTDGDPAAPENLEMVNDFH